MSRSEFGTIRGRVVYDAPRVPRLADLQRRGGADRDPQVCARDRAIPDRAVVIDPRTRGVADAVAYLVDPRGTNRPIEQALLARSPRVVIDQKNCEFVPRVAAIHQGQELVFTSSDPIIHSIHLIPLRNAGINRLMSPEHPLKMRLVAEKTAIPIECDLHFWMHGAIRVFDHPFFAKTAEDGSFEIAGVPAGVQRLAIWHERGGFLTPGQAKGTSIAVPAGAAIDIGKVRLTPEKIGAYDRSPGGGGPAPPGPMP